MNAHIRKLAWMSFPVVFLVGSVLADSASLQDKLEREVALKLDDVTIAEALEKIGAQAGIDITLSEEAIWELPEGAQTRLSVTLEGRLDQSLEEMLNAFFMRYAVGSDAVVIYPRPELGHIMGRPTAKTLELLRNIYTNSMAFSGASDAIERMSPSAISLMAGEEITIVPLDMSRAVTDVIEQMVAAGSERTTIRLASVLDEVVESVSRGHDRWLVCAAEWPNQVAQIKIISNQEYSAIMGSRPIDISFEAETGLTILRQLSAMADIELTYADDDRTWLERKVSIEVLNVPVERALERILDALGGKLRTLPGPQGVRYVVDRKPPVEGETPTSRAQAAANARARAMAARRAATSTSTETEVSSEAPTGQYVGKISIPMDGGRYFIEFMLRESDLTEELRRLRAERIQAILQAEPTPEPVEEASRP